MKSLTDQPGGLEIGHRDLFQTCQPASNSQPELFGSLAMDAAVEETPRLDKNVISEQGR